jgi:hypothetical protein
MSIRQARHLAELLARSGVPRNRLFGGGPVTLSVARITEGLNLTHGLKIRLLSPRPIDLERLGAWEPDRARGGGQSAGQSATPSDVASGRPVDRPVYIACATEDLPWERRIRASLRTLTGDEPEVFVDADKLEAGQDWAEAIARRAIERAGAAVVLVSPAALASQNVTRQIGPLAKAAARGSLALTWVLVEPCDWESTALAEFRALNGVDKPLAKLRGKARDEALDGIARALQSLRSGRRETQQRRRAEPELGPPDVEQLANSAFRADTSIPNAASVAFLAEFHGKTLLVGGDARADVLCESIRTLVSQTGRPRIRVDAFVVPHGGSAGNVSRELLELLDCDRYLISSDGSRHRHPSRETIARILTFGRAQPDRPITLVFNYRSQFNNIWDDPKLKRRYRYEAVYPDQGKAGIKVQI